MSRTYRKNTRRFHYYKGEFYGPKRRGFADCNGRPISSVKANFEYRDYNDIFDYNNHIYPECYPACFESVVRVCDGDNYGNGIGGKNKTILHKVDRARYRNALNRCIVRDDYDRLFDVKPAYNPWDWS